MELSYFSPYLINILVNWKPDKKIRIFEFWKFFQNYKGI